MKEMTSYCRWTEGGSTVGAALTHHTKKSWIHHGQINPSVFVWFTPVSHILDAIVRESGEVILINTVPVSVLCDITSLRSNQGRSVLLTRSFWRSSSPPPLQGRPGWTFTSASPTRPVHLWVCFKRSQPSSRNKRLWQHWTQTLDVMCLIGLNSLCI